MYYLRGLPKKENRKKKKGGSQLKLQLGVETDIARGKQSEGIH